MKNEMAALAAASMILVAAACSTGKDTPAASNGPPRKVPNVSVEPVATRDMVEKIVITGQVAPDQEVKVSAETGGLVEKVHPAKGGRVKAGDPLAEIDRRQLKAALDRARAGLEQAGLGAENARLAVRRAETAVQAADRQLEQSRLAVIQAEKLVEKGQVGLDNQRRQFERLRKLYEEKWVSQAAYDDAASALRGVEADLAAARAGLDAAGQAVSIAEANSSSARLGLETAGLGVKTAEAETASQQAAVAQATLQLEKGLILAPFDAQVDDIFYEEGEFVKAESELMRLIKTDPMLVKVSLAEKDVPHVRRGEPAEITVSSLPGRAFSGNVSFVALSADPATNTYPVEITVADGAGDLKSGMVASVTLIRRRFPGAVSVPTFAVIPKEDGEVAFVLENDRAARRKVVTGILENGWVQVVEGLEPGDALIVKGQRDLEDGQEVKVQP